MFSDMRPQADDTSGHIKKREREGEREKNTQRETTNKRRQENNLAKIHFTSIYSLIKQSALSLCKLCLHLKATSRQAGIHSGWQIHSKCAHVVTRQPIDKVFKFVVNRVASMSAECRARQNILKSSKNNT